MYANNHIEHQIKMIVYIHNYNILSDHNIITEAEIVSIGYNEQINSVASKRKDDHNLLL